MGKMTKIQSLQPKPCWDVSRGSKGQSSRERGMDRKAMDERNMRERFWRLRERALVDKLHDLLPDSYKSVKLLLTRKAEQDKHALQTYRLCLLQGDPLKACVNVT